MATQATIAAPPQRVLPSAKGKARTRVSKALRRRQIITRLLEGASNQSIAEELGIAATTVSTYIHDVLATWEGEERGEVDKVRALQVARIDRIVSAHFPDAVGTRVDEDGNAVAPSRGAAELVLKAEAMRARIVGTEAARKVEVSGSLGFHLDPEEIEREQRAWLASGGEAIDGVAREIKS